MGEMGTGNKVGLPGQRLDQLPLEEQSRTRVDPRPTNRTADLRRTEINGKKNSRFPSSLTTHKASLQLETMALQRAEGRFKRKSLVLLLLTIQTHIPFAPLAKTICSFH